MNLSLNRFDDTSHSHTRYFVSLFLFILVPFFLSQSTLTCDCFLRASCIAFLLGLSSLVVYSNGKIEINDTILFPRSVCVRLVLKMSIFQRFLMILSDKFIRNTVVGTCHLFYVPNPTAFTRNICIFSSFACHFSFRLFCFLHSPTYRCIVVWILSLFPHILFLILFRSLVNRLLELEYPGVKINYA